MTGHRWQTCSVCASSYRLGGERHVCEPGRVRGAFGRLLGDRAADVERSWSPAPTPGQVYVDEVRAARGRGTWRLLAVERRLRRAHRLDPRALARWAAVRSVLRERHVILPDA